MLVALAALGAAALGTRAVSSRSVAGSRSDAEKFAGTTRQKAADALRLQVRNYEIRAQAAAGLQPLVAQLALLRQHKLEGDVAKTLLDWFGNEPYWEPFRKEFPVYGLSVDGDQLAVVSGMDANELASELLVRRARQDGLASDTVMGKGRAYAAAAATVVVPTLPRPVVLVLARPHDDATLKDVADRTGGAVLLSDGKKALGQSGASAELERLASVVGQEASPVVTSQEGEWAAVPVSVAPGLWLWVFTSSLSAARETAMSAKTAQVAVWGAGAVVALLALVFGLRRPAAPLAPAPTEIAALTSTTSRGRAPSPAGYEQTIHAGGAVPAPRITATGAAAAGAQFGRYTLIDQLGEGGMSQVYTAVTFGAEGFRRKFVVKRLRAELAADPVVVAQFTDEANLASTLVHSNVVPVFDFGKVGDEYYLATEYILGRDLGRVVRKMVEKDGKPPVVNLVLHCAHETLKALEYAHTKLGENGKPLGIVHRDVSPANVLVSARGEVKLFDFGIVKAEGRVTRTEHGVVKGNVSFMSPEQARGIGVDARADLFSMGLVMYYCFTGDVLYQGNTTYELLVKAATGPDPDDMAKIGKLPPAVATVLTRALQIDPALRYQSAAEFAAAVAPLIRGGSKELSELMQRLFADDFREEERRFSSPTPETGARRS